MALLFKAQYAAFGYHEGTVQYSFEHAPVIRRASLLIACMLGGVAWFLLRRYTRVRHRRSTRKSGAATGGRG